MSAANPSPGDRPQPGRYEIRLKGYLDVRWAAWFEGLTVSHERDDTTLIQGPIIDQSALYGVLRKVRDLGLPLLSVMQVDSEPTNETDVHENTDHTQVKKETDR